MAVRMSNVSSSLISRLYLRNVIRALYSSKATSTSSSVPRNVLENVITAHKQPENGVVYDKKPFKIYLEAGKNYVWCLCGRSKENPFCDGTHKIVQLKITQKPVRFQVEESKEYWICNCKHTNNRPFCDGTHKLPIVQEANSIVRQ